MPVEVGRTAMQPGAANHPRRRALLLVNQHARRGGEAIGAALAVLAAGGVTVEEHDYPKRGCVGVSAAVYANRGFELCAAWPIVVQKSSGSYRDGRAVRDGVPGRVFWHRQPAEAAVQGGSVRGLRPRRTGRAGCGAASAGSAFSFDTAGSSADCLASPASWRVSRRYRPGSGAALAYTAAETPTHPPLENAAVRKIRVERQSARGRALH